MLTAALVSGAAAWYGCGGSSVEPPPPPPGAIPPGQSIGTAAISGRVRFSGTPPARRPLKMSGEAACHRPGSVALSEDLVVDEDASLRNVFVHVVAGLGDRVFAPPAAPAVIDQQGCLFLPHVLSVQADQVIEFRNSDPVSHNVRSVTKVNRAFNVSISGRGRGVRRYFSQPEVVKIRCDIHAWMGAFVAVERHPFHAVTGDGGAFSLSGLPAGTYEVEAWHETLGSARQTVTLLDGESRTLEFVFGPQGGRP